jgi:hypothetical protein
VGQTTRGEIAVPVQSKYARSSKRQAHSKVVEMVLNGGKPGEKVPVAAIGS